MSKKATISVHETPVIAVEKRFLRLYDSKKKIVYFIRGNKSVKYAWGRRSRILYVGKTERAGSRPFESLRENAPDLLSKHGIKSPEVIYIEVAGRQKVDIASKLERACLRQFRSLFGKVPFEQHSKSSKFT